MSRFGVLGVFASTLVVGPLLLGGAVPQFSGGGPAAAEPPLPTLPRTTCDWEQEAGTAVRLLSSHYLPPVPSALSLEAQLAAVWLHAMGAVRLIVATVPDPGDPPLAMNFDRQLDAVIAATQSAGFALEDQDIPWVSQPPRGRLVSGEAKSNGEDRQSKKPEDSSAPSHRLGALLFRFEPPGCPEDGKEADEARCRMFHAPVLAT